MGAFGKMIKAHHDSFGLRNWFKIWLGYLDLKLDAEVANTQIEILLIFWLFRLKCITIAARFEIKIMT